MAFKDYYSLTKGGLAFGNVITVAGGFFLGVHGGVQFASFVGVVLGMMLVMTSGCVANNYIDRDIDARMTRTQSRALVMGRVSGRNALIFGTILGALGFLTLAIYTNLLALGAAAFGFFFYVVMYSLWSKRRTAESTIVGSFAGAVPPVAGYVAASGRPDTAAAILFALMIAWQVPHFYAIAIRRADEYAAAGVPVLPSRSGIHTTKIRMLVFIVAFILIAPLLTPLGYVGYTYFAGAILLGLVWLTLCISGLGIADRDADIRWARKMFISSLAVIMLLFTLMAVTALMRVP